MKKILFVLSVLVSSVAYSQTTGFFRYDTIAFQKSGGNAEFNLYNSTRNTTNGILINKGGGRTYFSSLTGSKNATRDSIIFTLGTLRIAVKDSVGSGGGIDSVIMASQFDISRSQFGLTRLDTLFTDVVIDGDIDTTDNAFPSVIWMNNGKLLLGGYNGFNHNTRGRPWYSIIDSTGLGVINRTLLQTDTFRNYHAAVPSKLAGDTILIAYTNETDGTIIRVWSVDNAVTISAKDSINSSFPDHYNALAQAVNFNGLNIMPIYKSVASNKSGVIVSPWALATTWDTIWFTNSSSLLLSEASDPVIEGDTLKLFLRSDAHTLDTVYMVYTLDGRTYSTPVPITVPGYVASKPDVKRALDGTYIMGHRTTGVPPQGQISVSRNKGYTWESLYAMTHGFFTYSSGLQLGDSRWIFFIAGFNAGPGTGDIFRDVDNITSRGVNNLATNLEPNATPQIIESELIRRTAATSGVQSINGQTGPAVTFEVTTTGSDNTISQAGNLISINLPEASGFSSGKVIPGSQVLGAAGSVKSFAGLLASEKTTLAGLLQTGATTAVFENTGGSDPAGASGPSVRLFRTAIEGGWIQGWDGTTNAYNGLNYRGSAHVFKVGNVTIENNLIIDGLTASRLVSTNGSKQLQSTVVGYGLTGLSTLAVDSATIFPQIRATIPSGSQTPWTSDINADGFTLHGNDGSAETLTLSSTSHATKGKILFGSVGVFDQANERFGIGTTSPSVPLHIVSGGNVNAWFIGAGYSQMIFGTGTGGSQYAEFYRPAAGRFSIENTGKDISFSNGSGTYSGADGIVIKATTHNVGIGTDGPSEKLDVSGNANVTGSVVIKSGLVGVGGVYHTNLTNVGNVGAGEDDLMTKSVDAGLLANDKEFLEFTLTFTVSANVDIKVYFGATQLVLFSATAANSNYHVTGRIFRTGAATQKAFGEVYAGTTFVGAFRALPTETLSGAVTFKATGEGTSNDDVVQTSNMMKWNPAK